MTAPGRPCPRCQGTKAPRQYLCRTCWSQLPAQARTALNRTDPMAFRRLSDLLDQLREGTPLTEIEVQP